MVEEVDRADQSGNVFDRESLRKERCRRYDECISTYCHTCKDERPATGIIVNCRECREPGAEESQANLATDYSSDCGIPASYVRLMESGARTR